MTSIQTVILPSTITGVNRYAFAGCTALSTVNLQDTKITKIGLNAFENDAKFTTLRLPETLTEIGDFAFRKAGINSVTYQDRHFCFCQLQVCDHHFTGENHFRGYHRLL